MALSRKHYEKIADILRGEFIACNEDELSTDSVDEITFQLADYFAEDNPNFDRIRFLNAANPDVPAKRGITADADYVTQMNLNS